MTVRALVLSVLLGAISLFVTGGAQAAEEYDPQDERAATFVSGKADVLETFGETSGAALFGAGAASILAVFVILFFAEKAGGRNLKRLEKMDSSV